jgi:hypothetical protein
MLYCSCGNVSAALSLPNKVYDSICSRIMRDHLQDPSFGEEKRIFFLLS